MKKESQPQVLYLQSLHTAPGNLLEKQLLVQLERFLKLLVKRSKFSVR